MTGSRETTPLHAHEVTPNDAAFMRMMAGATFGPDVEVTLPSGKTITGAEMAKWVEAADTSVAAGVEVLTFRHRRLLRPLAAPNGGRGKPSPPSGRKSFRDMFTALHGFRYWPPRAILRNFKR
jgi:hypothetical protein